MATHGEQLRKAKPWWLKKKSPDFKPHPGLSYRIQQHLNEKETIWTLWAEMVYLSL
jgi:hypothetical protein